MIFNVVQLSSNWWQFSSMFGLLRSSCSGRACFSSFHSCHFSSVAALDPAGYVAQVLERLKTRCPNNILRLIISPINSSKTVTWKVSGHLQFSPPQTKCLVFFVLFDLFGTFDPSSRQHFRQAAPPPGSWALLDAPQGLGRAGLPRPRPFRRGRRASACDIRLLGREKCLRLGGTSKIIKVLPWHQLCWRKTCQTFNPLKIHETRATSYILNKNHQAQLRFGSACGISCSRNFPSWNLEEKTSKKS